MRLWSLHPKYLDRQGLVACWREGLLAQAVLLGKTKGYKNHSQLERFKKTEDPVYSIGWYLAIVWKEAENRMYNFNYFKIQERILTKVPGIAVTDGQLRYEARHLKEKIFKRDIDQSGPILEAISIKIEPHPLFTVISGSVEPWEKVKNENHIKSDKAIL